MAKAALDARYLGVAFRFAAGFPGRGDASVLAGRIGAPLRFRWVYPASAIGADMRVGVA